MKSIKPLHSLACSLFFWGGLVLVILSVFPFHDDAIDHVTDIYADGSAIASIQSDPQIEPPGQPLGSLPVEVEVTHITGALRSGEGFDDSLKRFQLPAGIRVDLIEALSGTLDFRRLRPGDHFDITLDKSNGELIKCVYESGPLNIYTVDRSDVGYIAEKVAIPLELRTVRLTGVIQSSLFVTFTELGEEPKLVHEYAGIFASKIDFNTESRPGDRIELVYEKYFKDDAFVGYGKIISASYEQTDKLWQGHFYASAETPVGYYDIAGEELGTSFLRSPIPFGRVTSRFSYRRKHPITKVVRPHLGIDLAAPAGTPILAASEGKVIQRGRNGGFGKTVIVKHAGGYKTHYGHLSRYAKNIKVGSRVQQKDVIGYVGSTGISTGPHLDYRISINGVFKNPFSLKFKPNHIITGDELTSFQQMIIKLSELMDSSDDATVLQVKNIVLSKENNIFFL